MLSRSRVLIGGVASQQDVTSFLRWVLENKWNKTAKRKKIIVQCSTLARLGRVERSMLNV
jgi:hypothetical protein